MGHSLSFGFEQSATLTLGITSGLPVRLAEVGGDRRPFANLVGNPKVKPAANCLA